MDELGLCEGRCFCLSMIRLALSFCLSLHNVLHISHSLIHTLECGSSGDHNKHITSAYQM
jgi:hypothetical protein